MGRRELCSVSTSKRMLTETTPLAPRAGSLLVDSQTLMDSKSLAESINISGDATGCGKGSHPFCKAWSTDSNSPGA